MGKGIPGFPFNGIDTLFLEFAQADFPFLRGTLYPHFVYIALRDRK